MSDELKAAAERRVDWLRAEITWRELNGFNVHAELQQDLAAHEFVFSFLSRESEAVGLLRRARHMFREINSPCMIDEIDEFLAKVDSPLPAPPKD